MDASRKSVMVREKGRKKNYSQFNLRHEEWRKKERLLNTEEIKSFLEISCKASACPLPLNLDTYDAEFCNYSCIYCYANFFRAKLYPNFFDNSRTMGIRHCNPDYYKRELDKMLPLRELSFEKKSELKGIEKAFSMNMPIRMGIRFEDFLKKEAKLGVSLTMLEYLKDISYPVMINTKSDLLSSEPYLCALAENPAKAAVHLTILTSNETITKKLEPGAPSYARRLASVRALNAAGVRVVPRIEPFLFLLCDDPEDVHQYMEDMWDAGSRHITFDTYSYTSNSLGIRQSFINLGWDYDRMYQAGCESQPLGSLLLGKFMEMFRERGFSCSTFDMGNNPTNDQTICCEVEDLWKDGGWNYGCTVMAARYIGRKKGKPVTWGMFEKYVDKHGGFLTEDLKEEVHRLWNLGGNVAYSHRWAAGLVPVGRDENGLIWKQDGTDYIETLLEEII